MRTLLIILSFLSLVLADSGLIAQERVPYDSIIWNHDLCYSGDELFTGTAYSHYSNGQLIAEGNYKDGKRYGLHIFWYENGQQLYERNYKDGKPVGLWKLWYENGQLKEELNLKDGLCKGWYGNGQLFYERKNKAGELDRLERVWYYDGQLMEEWNFNNGLGRGWHENGQLKIEGKYKNIKPDDLSRFITVVTYDSEFLQLVDRLNISGSQMHSYYMGRFFPNDSITDPSIMAGHPRIHRYPVGLWRWWDENGKKIRSKSYSHFHAPDFLQPVRLANTYNTHGIYAGLFLKDNKIKSNGIHASVISGGNDIKVNGISASVISIGNDIQVNGIHASIISMVNDIQVNGLYVNLIQIDGYGISLINTSLNIPILPKISFTGLALGPRISLAQLSIGRFNVGIVNTNWHPGSRGLGALNFNINCSIPISPIIGGGCRDRRYWEPGPVMF